jgi:hypothetical protein
VADSIGGDTRLLLICRDSRLRKWRAGDGYDDGGTRVLQWCLASHVYELFSEEAEDEDREAEERDQADQPGKGSS